MEITKKEFEDQLEIVIKKFFDDLDKFNFPPPPTSVDNMIKLALKAGFVEAIRFLEARLSLLPQHNPNTIEV